MPLGIMASTGLWVDICLLGVLFCHISICETTHDAHQQDTPSRRSWRSHRPLTLREGPELQQGKREPSRDDLSRESYHRKELEDRLYKHRQGLDHQQKSSHLNDGSLYNKLAPFISEKNLLALKRLFGDDRDSRNRHRNNLYSYESKHGKKNEYLHTYENRLDKNLHTYENRQDDKYLHTYENSKDEHLHTYENRKDENLHTYENRQDERLHTYENRNDRYQQRKRDRSHRQQYDRDHKYRNDERDRSRYGNRYVDEYNKRYLNSNNRDTYNLAHYRERSSYRTGGSSYRRPQPVNRKKSYHNLRARLEKLDHEDEKDQRYESRLRHLRARLTKNLLNIDQSPVKSLLRAADDLDCAAQLQCIHSCTKREKKLSKKDQCSQTCEEEIQCDDENEDEDLCFESGHDSCGGPQGTGSTKGPLLELANNECC